MKNLDNIGKIPPQAVDIEEYVLGTLLTDMDAYDNIAKILTAEMFYKAVHQQIFSIIVYLFNNSKPTDLLTVTEHLRKKGILDDIGGPMYLVKLTEKFQSSRLIEHHALIVKEKYMKRQLIKVSSEINSMAYDETNDLQDLINFAEKSLFALTENMTAKDPRKLLDINIEYVEKLSEIAKREVRLSGVPSGLTRVDRISLGWQQSDLIIMAARPSMGKTALALQLAKNAASFNVPVLFFSVEMAEEQLAMRMISNDTGIDSRYLKIAKDLDWEKIDETIYKSYNQNIYIDDTPSISVYSIRSLIRKYKRKYNIGLVVVDYIQLCKGDPSYKRDRNLEVGSITKTLKAAAKETKVPIIALSQLNRDIEKRSSHPFPILSDLRDSGEIEQDADVVIFPTRICRLPDHIQNNDEWVNHKEHAVIQFAKHRNGATGGVFINVSSDASRWEDIDATIYSTEEEKNIPF